MWSYYIILEEDGNIEHIRFDVSNEENLYAALAETMDIIGFKPFNGTQENNFNFLSVSSWQDKETGDFYELEWEWTGDKLMFMNKI